MTLRDLTPEQRAVLLATAELRRDAAIQKFIDEQNWLRISTPREQFKVAYDQGYNDGVKAVLEMIQDRNLPEVQILRQECIYSKDLS